jgi:hypothetical protein
MTPHEISPVVMTNRPALKREVGTVRGASVRVV